jgi:hypothetical protein
MFLMVLVGTRLKLPSGTDGYALFCLPLETPPFEGTRLIFEPVRKVMPVIK